ncbi:hypothetical protein B0F90DRAFT_1814930 [Multifurca ochricompacta]|uniref:GATA-type domain-containing protein n=1 Tax=Multifurca ochricompacta TaxID=376703 RepID=A0AAD4M9Q8_9AGAM|nr:hypothetical protein B0F90DRAFT_1814930 [Multifurca ochricompacta]
MPHRVEPITFATRYVDHELVGLIHPSPLFQISVSSHSPIPSSSWDISSEASSESGLIPDIPVTGSYPERIAFGSMLYDYPNHDHYRHSWEVNASTHIQDVRSRVLEQPLDVPVVPSQLVGSSRGESYCLPGRGNDEIFYTDEANTKLNGRMRRRCFNCKATETSTWRRSVLSLGKLLCNKCGLFERTHAIPRPKKFPRRRRHNAISALRPSAHSNTEILPSRGAVNHHYQDSRPTSLPRTTHHVHALDPTNETVFPPETPWPSPITPNVPASPARVGSYHSTSEQPKIFHPDHQLPSSALAEAIWV